MSNRTTYKFRDLECPCGYKAQVLVSEEELAEGVPCPKCGGTEFKPVMAKVVNRAPGYVESPLSMMDRKFSTNPTWDRPAAKQWFERVKGGKRGINGV